jgi:bifunctional enzyme CysN/CysC
VAAGELRAGAEVLVLPIGAKTRITAVNRYFDSCETAESGDAVSVRLADELDVGRGYMLVDANDPAPVTTRFTADLCWMNDAAVLRPRQQFWLKHTTRRVKCLVEGIDDRLEVASYERTASPDSLVLNDIGRITIKTMEPVFMDEYATSRDTGSFILVDPASRQTVAAGMVREILSQSATTPDNWAI